MKKKLSLFLTLEFTALCALVMFTITQCRPTNDGSLPVAAWTDGDEYVGQLVSEVTATVQDDEVTITYNLADDADVWVIPSFDQGMSYCGALQSVTGDVGSDVTKGKDKTIVWNYRKEQELCSYPFDINKVKLKVFADSPVPFNTTPYVVYNGDYPQLISPDGDIITDSAKYIAIIDGQYTGAVLNFMPITVKDRSEKWGMIDHAGREVVPCKYDHLVWATPFLYFAIDDSDMVSGVQILSNSGKPLGEPLSIDSVCNGFRDAISIWKHDSIRHTKEWDIVPAPVFKGYIGKDGEIYSEYRPIGEFIDKAYYPFAYKEDPDQKLVIQGYVDSELSDSFTRGFESLNEEFWLNGRKISFVEYMKDSSRGEYDYYLKMGYNNHAFRLPKGISPDKRAGSDHTEYLTWSRIVKAIDDNTDLVGVYSIDGSLIIPCEWRYIYVNINDNYDDNERITNVNYYFCTKPDRTGIICIPSTEVEDTASYKVIAYTMNDRVTQFANPETQRALSPDKHRWIVDFGRGNGNLITLKDSHRGTFALIDHDGRLVADKVIRVTWVDSDPFTKLIGLKLEGESKVRYYDITAHKFVDGLNGAEPYGYIPADKYCMRVGDRTVVYDAAQGKITHSARDKVPVNEYDENRIILTDKSGTTYLADSTLAVVTQLDIKLSKGNIFSEELSWVSDINGGYHLIDANGKVITPIHGKSRRNGLFYDFHSGLCRIVKNGKYGYTDNKGRVVIPCIYEDAQDFQYDHAIVSDDGDHWGVIDRNGAMIYPCVFTSIALARSRAL